MTTSAQTSTCLALMRLMVLWAENVVEAQLVAATLGRGNRTKLNYYLLNAGAPTYVIDPTGEIIDDYNSDGPTEAILAEAIATSVGMKLYLAMETSPIYVRLRPWSEVPPAHLAASPDPGGAAWWLSGHVPLTCAIDPSYVVEVAINIAEVTAPDSGVSTTTSALLVHEMRHVVDILLHGLDPERANNVDELRAYGAQTLAYMEETGTGVIDSIKYNVPPKYQALATSETLFPAGVGGRWVDEP